MVRSTEIKEPAVTVTGYVVRRNNSTNISGGEESTEGRMQPQSSSKPVFFPYCSLKINLFLGNEFNKGHKSGCELFKIS